MTSIRRVVVLGLLLPLGAVSLASNGVAVGDGLLSAARAQPIRNLIARLRGETLPAGIVKSNGRIEATQVDVSSKYAGRLEEVTVEEGSTVTQGQMIARISSPEYEAQLRAAQSNVQRAKDALASAEAEITSRESALEFAKSDFQRGQELMKTGFITKQAFEQRKRNFDSAAASVRASPRSAIRLNRRSKTRKPKWSESNRLSRICLWSRLETDVCSISSPGLERSSQPARRSSPFSTSPTSI